MQVPLEDPGERLLELLVGHGVAERIHWRVGVAQEVREEEPVRVGAFTEALHDGQDVVRRPAQHEAAQDERDGAKGLACPILAL